MSSSRRLAREQALQALYAIEIADHQPDEAIGEILSGNLTTDHRAFVRDLVLGVIENRDELDAAIAPLLQRWSVERLPVIDRSILRIGAFELLHGAQTPRAVAINEAVELAKKFSTEESGKYINGVLSAISHG